MTTSTQTEGPKDFGVLLHHLEDGQLHADLSLATQELAGKLAHVAKAIGQAKGELVLRIKMHADEGGTVQIDAEIKVKEPQVKRGRSVMWLSKGNNLIAENPKQQKLFPREVPSPGAPRDLPAAPGEPRSV